MAMCGTPDMVLPAGKQRSRTLQHINTLMEKDVQPVHDQMGNLVGVQLPVIPNKRVENFKVARDTMREFWQENGDYEKANPGGWQRTEQYYDMLIAQETQTAAEEAQRTMQVKMAGMPPPPQQDPNEKAALDMITQDGARAVQRLQQLSEMPPQPPGVNVTPQVTASYDIVRSALDAQKAAKQK